MGFLNATILRSFPLSVFDLYVNTAGISYKNISEVKHFLEQPFRFDPNLPLPAILYVQYSYKLADAKMSRRVFSHMLWTAYLYVLHEKHILSGRRVA